MSSLKSLAAELRKKGWIFTDLNRNVFEAAVLEIAHAISRGRKPSSCSVLPGQNIQAWLRRTFYLEIPYGYSARRGKYCSFADDKHGRDMLLLWMDWD
jgi:hypothetical protein